LKKGGGDLKLQYKITLFLTVLLAIVIGGIGLVTLQQIDNTVETQMGSNAMDLAVTIASMERIQELLATTKDYEEVQKIIESFREKTRFQYIIVMDMNGIKYSYPIEYALGKKYISGGEERTLKYGEAYISKDRNVLISAIRACAPIYYQGEQVGAVLVGLLTNTVYEEIRPHIFTFEMTLLIGFVIAIIGAWILSHIIKRSTFGLEPKEIALLLGQRNVILQSLNTGILAIDEKGKIMLFNKTAKKLLGLGGEAEGKDLSTLPKHYADQILEVLRTEEPIYNREVRIRPGQVLLCSHTLLKNYKDEIIGVVSTFQDLTEVKQMAEELTGFKKMTDALRAQNHEFMNQLHTISGLIQLEEYEKALEYISQISQDRQQVSGVLNDRIKNAHVAAILLAKYNKATEAKILMEIDPESNLEIIPKTITVGEICSVIGNLIENAIDELVKMEGGRIEVGLFSDEKGLKIMVSDNGPGIKKEIAEKIFEKGVTTKEGNRGIGLNIVKEIVDNAGGTIRWYEDNGTTWDVYIPARKGIQHD